MFPTPTPAPTPSPVMPNDARLTAAQRANPQAPPMVASFGAAMPTQDSSRAGLSQFLQELAMRNHPLGGPMMGMIDQAMGRGRYPGWGYNPNFGGGQGRSGGGYTTSGGGYGSSAGYGGGMGGRTR